MALLVYGNGGSQASTNEKYDYNDNCMCRVYGICNMSMYTYLIYSLPTPGYVHTNRRAGKGFVYIKTFGMPSEERVERGNR